MGRALLSIAVLLLVGGCAVPLSRDVAIAIALREQTSSIPVTVASAAEGPLGRFVDDGSMPSEPRDRQVWAIVLRGRFEPASCGPAPLPGQSQRPCPEPATTQLIVLDAATGDYVVGITPAP